MPLSTHCGNVHIEGLQVDQVCPEKLLYGVQVVLPLIARLTHHSIVRRIKKQHPVKVMHTDVAQKLTVYRY